MVQPPIVMQALWRTRGTYFWSLFRKQEGIGAYYEPLHEGLASNTDQKWARDFQYGGLRYLRHPRVDGHYFREYPLCPEGGVALFDASMSFGKFMLSEHDEDPVLANYLRSPSIHGSCRRSTTSEGCCESWGAPQTRSRA